MKSTTRRRPVRLLNTSGGEVVFENTVADRTYVVSSVKLYQEGIEPVQGVHRRRTRVVSSLEARITKDSEILCQVGIEHMQSDALRRTLL
jgi:hypothetical protein